jgi:hypothetical protein
MTLAKVQEYYSFTQPFIKAAKEQISTFVSFFSVSYFDSSS